MKVVDSLAMLCSLWAIPVPTIGILVIDLLTPVGMVASILYVIPLLLTWFSPSKRDLFYFSIVATALIRINLFFKPPGIPMSNGAFNRMIGMIVLWDFSPGLIHYRLVREGLIDAETI